MRSERRSEKPQDEGSLPSRSTMPEMANFTPIKVRGETDRRLRPTQHLILCRQVYGVIPSGESPAQKRDRSN